MLRPRGDGDLLRNLEAEKEVGRGRIEQLSPVSLRGKLVESEVPADRRERLGVLDKAVVLEALLRVLAAGLVALRAVDRPQPTRILPRTRAEVDTLVGQRL